MKSCLAMLAVAVAMSSSSVLAQNAAADFWTKPGEVQRDAKGNVVYREVKDPATFTVQVFDRGKVVTYRYVPNSLKIARAEAGGITDEYLYGANGEWDGLTVHVKALALTLRATRNGAITAPGMPSLSATRDSLGRDAIWTSDGVVVGRVEYDTAGQVQRFTLGNAMTLAIDSSGGEVLRSPDGVVASTAAGARRSKREFRYSLDLVADQLGLGTDWANNVKATENETGSLLTLTASNGAVLAYVVQVGPNRAAFTAGGKPLFYDLPLNYSDRASPSIGGDVAVDPTVKLQSVLPGRLVIGANGDAGVYVERPADGAIQSFWISTSNGARKYSHRVFNPPKTRAQSLSMQPASGGSAVAVASRRRITPELYYLCDESTVCTYSDGCPSCGGCSITEYYCYAPDAGGGGTYDPSGGGGGTSSGSSSNQVTGDSTLRGHVSQGLSNATTKLANQQCLSIFSNLCDTNGNPLANVLAQKGYSASDWLNNGISIVNGYTNGLCSSVPAWTTVGGTTVNACTSFSNLTTTDAGNRLIHEELHTLGYSENPPDPNFMTSEQITNYVAANCS